MSGPGPGQPASRPWTPPEIDCETSRTWMSALLVDEQDPAVDRRALEAHLAKCDTCALPPGLVDDGRPTSPANRRPVRRRRRRASRWVPALILVIGAVVVIGPFAYFHYEGKAPAKLTLPVGPGGTTGPLNGTWSPGAGSTAEYRVEEDLFDQHHLAVGKTSKVSGTMTIVGATVTSARLVVDLASIKSDNAGRDTVFRDHLLDTSSHPDATFTLTRAIDLDTIPADGSTVTVPAVGTLDMRGVSRPVTFPLKAERHGGQLDVTGDLTIQWSQWHIPNPSFAITSVAKTGDIDLLILFNRTGPQPGG